LLLAIIARIISFFLVEQALVYFIRKEIILAVLFVDIVTKILEKLLLLFMYRDRLDKFLYIIVGVYPYQ